MTYSPSQFEDNAAQFIDFSQTRLGTYTAPAAHTEVIDSVAQNTQNQRALIAAEQTPANAQGFHELLSRKSSPEAFAQVATLFAGRIVLAQLGDPATRTVGFRHAALSLDNLVTPHQLKLHVLGSPVRSAVVSPGEHVLLSSAVQSETSKIGLHQSSGEINRADPQHSLAYMRMAVDPNLAAGIDPSHTWRDTTSVMQEVSAPLAPNVGLLPAQTQTYAFTHDRWPTAPQALLGLYWHPAQTTETGVAVADAADALLKVQGAAFNSVVQLGGLAQLESSLEPQWKLIFSPTQTLTGTAPLLELLKTWRSSFRL